jgi:flagellar L-ring protein FlgH
MIGRTRVALLLGLLIAAALSAKAQNPLIDLRTGRSLVSDAKALGVGDIVTIIIVESTTANATAKVDANSKSETSGGPGLGIFDRLTEWGLDTETKHTGDGKTSRTGDLQAEISVRIHEVLANGYFRLLGTRLVNINGDKQLIEISGLCRPQDIRADNTIMSTYIADAEIAYSGSGAIQDAAQPGVITRVMNWLF